LKARSDLRVPSIALHRGASKPLHRQIVEQIAVAIAAGNLDADARLPSSRSLARILRVSRNTVVAAYDDLSANGLIRVMRGAGVRVNGSGPLAGMPVAGLHGLVEAAHFPARVLELEDSDANPIYVRY